MKTYKVEYTQDKGATIRVMQVTAKDYTAAYLNACYAIPRTASILEVCVVLEGAKTNEQNTKRP